MPNPSKPGTRSGQRASVAPIDPSRYEPTAARPVRVKVRTLAANTQIQPHRHAWAQVAMSATGVIRMDAARSTYLVPPSRALWIPPGVEHVVSVVEQAEIHTLYVHQDAQHVGPGGVDGEPWRQCRVLEVSRLLRELVTHLPGELGISPPTARERHVSALVLEELGLARPVRLGVDLPDDKRLRSLCEAVLENPARFDALEGWAREAGASPRTVARLFRAELGTTFAQWRQQVLLARALTMAARRMPMSTIAAELGYASASAFSAMVRRSVGQPPSRFFT